ncbi:MAG: extracellular solute-binding protein [Bacilli bacterium]|nr:extracellular solute-binding protein [Bacilli bacterium]
MVKRFIKYGIALVILVVIVLIFNKPNVTYTPANEFTEADINNAFTILNDNLIDKRYYYIDFLKTVNINPNLADLEAELSNSNLLEDEIYEGEYFNLLPDEEGIYTVDIINPGYYYLQLDYQSYSDSLNDITIAVSINDEYQYDEAEVINLPLFWSDSTKSFLKDSYGDETLQTQVKDKSWRTIYLYNNTYYTVEPLLFKFNKGQNQVIKIKNLSADTFHIGKLRLICPDVIPSYEEYHLESSNIGNHQEYINAISYIEKNSSYVRMNSVKNPYLTPFHPIDKKLNVIDGYSWRKSGQEITYEIEVPHSGNYKLALYYQNTKNDFSVFRTIRIDGKVPFKEFLTYEFPMTKGNKWELEVLSDKSGKPYEVYLEAGKHYLSISATAEIVSESVRNIQLILDHINKFTLDIIKITGKEIDKNRTWNIVQYIPDTDKYLESYEILIKKMITDLNQYAPNKERSTTLSYLQKALYTLNKLREYPGKLPLYLEDLSGGSGSIAQMLGDTIRNLNEQPMSLDGIYIYNTEAVELPKVSFFKRIGASFASFFASFTDDKYTPKNDADVVDVWVNRPITYVDIMQKMVDSEFTPNTGIKVKISVMPDPNKIILASAANAAPDVALGLASYMPFDLAIRDAAYNLAEFPDFWQVASDFAPGAFIPYTLNYGVYALPETLDFHALIYRKDTFNALGLDVPDTWQDVIDILPELQRYGMNFYHPIAGGGALKWFYQTSALIYQYNGKIYTDDGLASAINEKEAVEALTFLNSLFTTYSLPEQVPSFYDSFRYNQLPVGIVDFNTYLQIKNAAPELIGQWELSAYPGTKQTDGSINRWYIANGSAGLIMKSTNKVQESWEFMKWWMSTEVQTNFARTLQSTYGPEYVWLSGNLRAVEGSPIENNHLKIILEQVKWLRDVPRTPGQYMLERGLSDIWNTAVFDNTPTGVAIDKQVIIINREIRKKMIEFGYLDKDGKVVKEYVVHDIEWIKSQMEEKGRKDE